MDSRYSYDQNNETWPIFTLALVSVVVVPVTIGWTLGGSDSNKSNNLFESLSPQHIKRYKKKTKAKSLFTKRFWFLLFGWALIFGLYYHIASIEYKPSAASFDPYEILGIDFGTPEKEIKSHFRKLSIKFHPDKVQYSSDEEKQQIEEHFVLITKAYQALTDEVTRENYEKYGHPDGPQTITHGIALPKWLIEGSTSPLLLVSYILIIGFVLPLIVSNWWNKTRSTTKKGINNKTASLFVENLLNYNPSQIVKVENFLEILSQSSEFSQYSTDEVLNIFNKHFERKPLTDSELNVVSQVPLLINGFIDISAAFRNLEFTTIAIETLKLFIQALKDNPYNELLQLPNVSYDSVKETNIIRISKLLTLPITEISEILGIKDESKLKETLEVASNIPILKLVEGKFKIPGEKIVTPSSNGYFSLKVLVKSPNHHGPIPSISPSKLEEDESLESLRDPYKVVNDQPELPIAYAPHFPREKTSSYIALVVVQSDSKIGQSPDFFTNLSLDNLKLSQEQYLKGEELIVGTIKIPFQTPTPPKAGKYEFRIILKSLDYFVQDLDTTIIIDVQDPPQVEEVDYELPEDEKEYDSDDDSADETDSDIEDADDEDFTDIDSDTDAEN